VNLPKPKLIRITTVPISHNVLLKGQHHFMAENNLEVIAVSSGGKELDEVAEREQIRTIAIDMTRTISPWKDLKSLWKFYRFCKKEKPQIVHSHTPKAGIVGMLGAKLAGVPVRMHTVAGLPLMEATGFKRKILNFVEKLTYRSATNVYPNSKGLYDFILQKKLATSKKLKVIAEGSSNGINTSYFSKEQLLNDDLTALKQRLNIQELDFVFIFVGRLVGDKGINELITAFKQLKITNVKLLLVGPLESELDPLLSETLQEIEQNPLIISIGFQKDVRPYFAISNCLVFPSYREGFPNVVMQAGAMELPSIVSNINGCNEIIKEAQNGLIIPPKNSIALHQAMRKIQEDKALYQTLQNNSRKMIVERYEQEKIWKAILEEYEQLLLQIKL
jgi:glycosyltransferase involved in cell wall biosynthesis